MIYTWKRESWLISTDPSLLDIEMIHRFLSQDSYWAKNVSKDVVIRSIEGSIVFGIYKDSSQIGFARVISDTATFAYLADVFVLPEYRGRGLAPWLMECVLSHPDLQGLRRWLLGTRDAHGLYSRFGFQMAPSDRFMEILHPYNPTNSVPT
jgi:GNAT superfamily N-acetyltransferase